MQKIILNFTNVYIECDKNSNLVLNDQNNNQFDYCKSDNRPKNFIYVSNNSQWIEIGKKGVISAGLNIQIVTKPSGKLLISNFLL